MIHKFKCDLLVSMSYNQIFGRSYQKFFLERLSIAMQAVCHFIEAEIF